MFFLVQRGQDHYLIEVYFVLDMLLIVHNN